MITLIMLSWKRVDNLIKAIETEFDGELISEVIVWNNNKDVDLRGKLPKNVRLIQSNEDFGMRTRFGAALFAKNDCILLHDDDMVLPKLTIQNLYDEWELDNEIMYGLNGRIPKADNTYGKSVKEGKTHIVIGRTMLLKRTYCVDFFQIERDLEAQPNHSAPQGHEDILMSYFVMSKSGRLNEILYSRYEDLPAPHAICDRDNHYEQRTEFMQDCQKYFEIDKVIK